MYDCLFWSGWSLRYGYGRAKESGWGNQVASPGSRERCEGRVRQAKFSWRTGRTHIVPQPVRSRLIISAKVWVPRKHKSVCRIGRRSVLVRYSMRLERPPHFRGTRTLRVILNKIQCCKSQHKFKVDLICSLKLYINTKKKRIEDKIKNMITFITVFFSKL